MRWSGQQVLDEGVGGEPALPGLRGLLRSVRTPEFAGTVFHEVEAKSLLNRVPGASRMPFSWTVNPYRGCSHACVYCVEGATRVLMADGRTRPIAALRVGDAVIGTEQAEGRRGARRYVRTTVLAHWSTVKPAHRLLLADGTRIVASGEHRFLTDRGWRHVTPGWCRSGRRPHLRRGSVVLGPGRFTDAPTHTPGYRAGYLCGLVRGDAAHPDALADAAARPAGSTPDAGPPVVQFPSERVALEAVARVHNVLAGVSEQVPDLVVAGGAVRPVAGGADPGPVGWPHRPGRDWSAGLVAGVLDALGVREHGELRIVAAPGRAGAELAGHVATALRALGFRGLLRTGADATTVVRLRGGSVAAHRLVQRVDPSVSAVRDLAGSAVAAAPGHEVVAVEPLGVSLPMFDITTGTGDFVAEGVLSHNCFARNTHTYLDLDAGADFDSQIVVKVNAARVLERELRAPRWRREPVAMGTNTDPYQRAEGRYRLMPGIIRALAGSGTPFSVLTKGTVLARDLPDIAAAAADVPVGLGVSIALVDRSLHAGLEPGAPTPGARLDLVRRITDLGVPCGVMIAPVLPLLTDSAEALDALLERVAAAGATGASVLALHLRPGTREWFLAWLAREYPALVQRYARLYRRGAYVDPGYRRELGERVAPLLRRHGLAGGVSTLRPGSGTRSAATEVAGGSPGSGAGGPQTSAPSSVQSSPADPPASEQLTLL